MFDFSIDGDLRNPSSINLLEHDVLLRNGISNGQSSGCEFIFNGTGSTEIDNSGFNPNVYKNWTSSGGSSAGSWNWKFDFSDPDSICDTSSGVFTIAKSGIYRIHWGWYQGSASVTYPSNCNLLCYINRGTGEGSEDTKMIAYNDRADVAFFGRPYQWHSFIMPINAGDTMEFSIERSLADPNNRLQRLYITIFKYS